MTEIRRAYLAWIAVCLVWGTTYLGIRIALETIPPFLMAALRWLAAGALLIAWLKARGEAMPARHMWPTLAMLGFLLIGVGNGCVVYAELTVPSGLTAVLVSSIPFWMIAVERFFPGRQPLTARRLVGLIVGFLGIVVLVWPELRLEGATGFLRGVVATQIACLGWAIGSSYARRRKAEESILPATALEMVFAGLMLALVAAVRGEWTSYSFTPRTFGALLYLTLVGSIVGFTAYAYALKHLPVATVSLYAYVNPVIAVVLGTLVLQEPLNPRLAVASGVVLAGMWMVSEG